MFFFKKKEKKEGPHTLVVSEEDREEKQNESIGAISAGYAATESAQLSAQQAASRFAKPSQYDRKLLDSGTAKLQAKRAAFSSGEPVIDPYTGEPLVLTVKEIGRAHV